MYIHEYQAKQLLKEHGIPVPAGGVATSVDEALDVARSISANRWAIKAQVFAGGRGAGHFAGDRSSGSGVRIVVTLDELQRNTYEMLGRVLITPQTGEAGREVERVYIERGCDVKKELYLAMLVDRSTSMVTLVASAEGGQDIEAVAARSPGAIIRHPIDILEGLQPDDARAVAGRLGLEQKHADEVEEILLGMYRMFVSLDLSLIEINPLAITRQGEVLALDAVLSFDDNALFRHPDIKALRDERELRVGELKASYHGFNYVKLDGNIGCMASGAGLAMATLDAVKYAGGEPANFLDIPPVVQASVVQDAFRLIASDPGVAAILVNVFGGGIMRCDTIADGLLTALHREGARVPVVIRLAGVNAELGVRRLKDSQHRIIFADSLTEAAASVVAAARRTHDDQRKSWWQKAHGLISGNAG